MCIVCTSINIVCYAALPAEEWLTPLISLPTSLHWVSSSNKWVLWLLILFFSSYNNSFSHWTFSNIVFLTSFLLSFSQCILLLFTYFNYFLSSYFLKLHSSEIKFFIFSIVLAARIISVFFCMWSVLVIFIFYILQISWVFD